MTAPPQTAAAEVVRQAQTAAKQGTQAAATSATRAAARPATRAAAKPTEQMGRTAVRAALKQATVRTRAFQRDPTQERMVARTRAARGPAPLPATVRAR